MESAAEAELDLEPSESVRVGDTTVTLLGTAHVSRASAELVRSLLSQGQYDAVAVELCPSRHNALINPDSLAKMDLFQVLKSGKAPMVMANLALGAYQQRLADQFGIEPGAEMRAAVEVARSKGLPVLLVDREIGITLKRIYRSVPWWQRFGILGGLMASLVTSEEVTEEEVERLKEGDLLETAFAEFAAERRELFVPLIEERDRYMSARLLEELASGSHRNVLVVIGAGHLKGMSEILRSTPTDPAGARRVQHELDQLPSPSRWPKLIPWVIVALILAGFAIGFSRSTDLGVSLVFDWVLINGGLSALGALVAGGHPLTIAGAFVAAPLTSLNPTIGAGMVTAAIEIFLRKPTVADFGMLRRDVTRWRGWWKNRVTRVLLVFVLSTLGSAAGTYIAGFRIFERLSG